MIVEEICRVYCELVQLRKTVKGSYREYFWEMGRKGSGGEFHPHSTNARKLVGSSGDLRLEDSTKSEMESIFHAKSHVFECTTHEGNFADFSTMNYEFCGH